jgi:hypothetical protein
VRTALLAGIAFQGIDIKDRYYHNFPTDSAFRSRLESNGFTVDSIEIIHRQTPLPEGVRGWYVTFAKAPLAGLSETQVEAAISYAEDLLRPSLCDGSGVWSADYVRLRFVAHRS